MTLLPRTLAGGRISPTTLPLGEHGRPLCRWCELEILNARRRTFCSDYCVHQWRLRTDPGYLRDQVFARDKGICAECQADTTAIYAALKRARGKERARGLDFYGLKSITARRSLWDADHILPVAEGGGQCDLDNLRTLCIACHRMATAELRQRLRPARQPRPPSAPLTGQYGSAHVRPSPSHRELSNSCPPLKTSFPDSTPSQNPSAPTAVRLFDPTLQRQPSSRPSNNIVVVSFR